jgi:glycosyltransferase involved in cell wall biosynthesis
MKNDVNCSVIILAKNEADRIETCLESVSWADEIIVIDNGSTDHTQAVAKKFGAKIFTSSGNNFSSLREFGCAKASGRWVLYIDADEVVPEKLKEEILQRTSGTNRESAYKLKRKNYYLGQSWPHIETLERLFLKSELQGWYGNVHESPKYSGTIGVLDNPLLHFTHRTLEEMVTKTNDWSGIEAQLRFGVSHPTVVWWRLLRVMFTGFYGSYIAQEGWKAGTVGLIESIYQAFSLFITYAKLWELQQHKKI